MGAFCTPFALLDTNKVPVVGDLGDVRVQELVGAHVGVSDGTIEKTDVFYGVFDFLVENQEVKFWSFRPFSGEDVLEEIRGEGVVIKTSSRKRTCLVREISGKCGNVVS